MPKKQNESGRDKVFESWTGTNFIHVSVLKIVGDFLVGVIFYSEIGSFFQKVSQ